MMEDFDQKAAEWDSNPIHWERSRAIANKMKEMLPLDKTMTGIEFGAGTGILSFLLQDDFGEIILLDNSEGMFAVMQQKIKNIQSSHLKAVLWDLEQRSFTDKQADVVFSQMVLHHVGDIGLIFSRFAEMVKPGGYLVIADLYLEDGSFHDAGFDGHLGFNPEVLAKDLVTYGFTKLAHQECYRIKKVFANGETKEFPVFLLSGQKVL
jgi:tRNA (cmo5U34)-methyltransferase